MPNNSLPILEVYDFDHKVKSKYLDPTSNLPIEFAMDFLKMRADYAKQHYNMELPEVDANNTSIETCIRKVKDTKLTKLSIHIISKCIVFESQTSRKQFSMGL